MDRTYAETVGETPFDWNRWLDSAIRHHPTLQDHDRKIKLASRWTTCACGNQCAIIPRVTDSTPGSVGSPVDKTLRKIGYDFYVALLNVDYVEAKIILRNIEARSAVLIQEELAKLNSK